MSLTSVALEDADEEGNVPDKVAPPKSARLRH